MAARGDRVGETVVMSDASGGRVGGHTAPGTVPTKAEVRRRIRAARVARRREVRSDERERAAIAAAVLAHLDACPQARAAGWGGPSAVVAVFRSTPSEPDTSALIDALHDRGVRVLVPRTREDLSLDWHELLPPTARTGNDRRTPVTSDDASRMEDDRDTRTGAAGDTADEPGHTRSREAGGATRDDRGGEIGDTAVDVGSAASRMSGRVTEDVHDATEHGRDGYGDGRAELPTAEDADEEGPALGLDAVADITAMILPGIAVDLRGHRLGQGGGCYDRTLPRMRPDTCRAVLLFDDEVLESVPSGDHDRPVPAVVTPVAGWRRLGGA